MLVRPHAEPDDVAYLYPVSTSDPFNFKLFYAKLGQHRAISGGKFSDIRRAKSTFLTALTRFQSAVRQAEIAETTVERVDVSALEDAATELANVLFPKMSEFVDLIERNNIGLVLIGTSHDELRFPWGLLRFDGRWLGEIVMFANERESTSVPRSGALRNSRPLSAGYAEDSHLPSSRGRCARGALEEMSALEKLVGVAGVTTLAPLSAGRVDAQTKATIDQWIGTSRSLFHFHAHQEPKDGAGYPSMRLRDRASVSSKDLTDKIYCYAPVVLNVCSSGVGVHGDDESFAAQLRLRGSPAICSTTGEVTDRFATTFVHALYDEASKAGTTMFQAVRRAQIRLLKETQHPMALFYVFEGDATHQLGR